MFGKSNIVLSSVLAALILLLFVSCSSKKSTDPTAQVPVLTTAAVSAVTQTTAQCGGTITSDGGTTITARGVCWSTNPNPTITESKTIDGAGAGSFISSITGLIDSTAYYIRAYATNNAGTGYGSAMWFTTLLSHSAEPVTDIDGNIYQTVIICDQIWMAENLRVTHYRNNDSIPNVIDNGTWGGLSTGAYCNFNNDTAQVAGYGRLYNWYAVSDIRKIAPAGWHVPSDSEWQILIDCLGGAAIAGGALKDTGSTYWYNSNFGATNESGFSGRAGGCRDEVGTYGSMGHALYLWSSTEQDNSSGWGRTINGHNTVVGRSIYFLKDGFSIRCVKD